MVRFFDASHSSWAYPATWYLRMIGDIEVDGHNVEAMGIDSSANRLYVNHETVLKIQKKRTPAEIEAAQKDDQEEDIFIFRDVVGESFIPGNFPLTKALSSHLKNDSEVVDSPLKHLFNRPRPYVADLRVHPVCKLSSEPSYPAVRDARISVRLRTRANGAGKEVCHIKACGRLCLSPARMRRPLSARS